MRRPTKAADRLAIVGVNGVAQLVEHPVLKIADEDVAGKVDAAVGAVAVELTIGKRKPLVPSLARQVVDPGQVGAGEGDNIELVALNLIGPGYCVGNRLVDQRLFDRMGRYALKLVAGDHADDRLAALVLADEHECLGEPGNRELGGDAVLHHCAGDALERKGDDAGDYVANVRPDLGGEFAEQVDLAVVNDQRHQSVGGAILGAIVGVGA